MRLLYKDSHAVKNAFAPKIDSPLARFSFYGVDWGWQYNLTIRVQPFQTFYYDGHINASFLTAVAEAVSAIRQEREPRFLSAPVRLPTYFDPHLWHRAPSYAGERNWRR